MIESDAFDRPSCSSPGPGEGVAATAARADIRGGLLKILTATLSAGDLPSVVDDTTGLLGRGIGLDSIEVLVLVGAIEEAFDITVDDEDLDPTHFKTVGSLVTFIQERLSS